MTSGLKNSPSQSASSTSERPKEKAKASKAGGSKAKISIALIGGVVIVAVCIILAVYFLVIDSKTEAEPNIPKELVFAQIVFGNGAQPGQPPNSDFFGKKLEEKFKKQFPRGESQLIDRGYEHSQLLGKFLKKRYVDSGFLNSQMNPKEMYWKSRDLADCLSTAAAVGAAMFQTSPTKYLSVPIHSAKHSLKHHMRFLDCPKVYDHLYQKCPGYNKKDFWSSAHSCAGKSPDEIFKKFCWDEAKTLYNLLKTDFPFEDTVKTKSELLQREFAKIWHFLSGIGEPPVLRTLFGPFMNDLLNNLQSAWDSREKKDRKKFKAYSVDILAISGLLGSFDVLQNYTIPGQEKIAEFNSLLIIELYDRAGEPVVKLYHKPEEVTNEDHQLIDLTSSIRNCSSSDCPLEKFTGSCDAVRSTYEEIAKECVRKK